MHFYRAVFSNLLVVLTMATSSVILDIQTNTHNVVVGEMIPSSEATAGYPPSPLPYVTDNNLLDLYWSVLNATGFYPDVASFHLRNEADNSCMEVRFLHGGALGGPVPPLAAATAEDCDPQFQEQQFTFRFVRNGAFTVATRMAHAYGGALNGGLRKDGVPVMMGRWVDSPSHHFRMKVSATSSGLRGVHFLNVGSGLCLKVGNACNHPLWGQSKIITSGDCDSEDVLQIWQLCDLRGPRSACWPESADK